jgi:hypothetical protein
MSKFSCTYENVEESVHFAYASSTHNPEVWEVTLGNLLVLICLNKCLVRYNTFGDIVVIIIIAVSGPDVPVLELA